MQFHFVLYIITDRRVSLLNEHVTHLILNVQIIKQSDNVVDVVDVVVKSVE